MTNQIEAFICFHSSSAFCLIFTSFRLIACLSNAGPPPPILYEMKGGSALGRKGSKKSSIVRGGLVLFWLLCSFCTIKKVLQYIDKENFFDSPLTSETTKANPK